MSSFKEKMNEYVERNKKNSRLVKTEIDEVCALIRTGFVDGSALIDDIVELLLNLNPAVTSHFAKEIFLNLSHETRVEFVSEFLSSEKIVKNAAHFGVGRCILLVNELLGIPGAEELVHVILKASAKKAYGKDGGQKAGEILYRLCLKSTRARLLSLDYSQWSETELINLSTWLESAMVHIDDEDVIASYRAFVDKYSLPHNSRVFREVQPISSLVLPTSASANEASIIAEGVHKIDLMIHSLQSEVNGILHEKATLSKEVEEVRSKLDYVIKENERLTSQLFELRENNSQLQEQIRMREMEVSTAREKISEMNERLEYAYKADKRAENQELVALKNDLARFLKLDYEAFKKLSAKEPPEYNIYYEGLVGVIENVFDSLRRKGIVFNEVNEG
jgi:uncharacterized protein YoxC